MWGWWLEFCGAQSAAELRRQYRAMNHTELRRRLLAALPFSVAAIYLPLWLCAAFFVLESSLEVLAIRALGRADPVRRPIHYLVMLKLFAASQLAYMAVPAMLWHETDSYAKSFAVGMLLINVVHLATIRTVHFPLALTAQAAATLVTLTSNTLFWVWQGKWLELGVSTIVIAAATYFVLITMESLHRMHREMFLNQQAAEEANDAKSRFLAQMSHEIRTPLNAILGMGIAEMSGTRSPETAERMATLVQSARGLSVLLNDILDMSAVQAGRLPIRPTVVDIRAETGATVALFSQQAADAGLELRVSFAEAVPDVARIDGQRMRQCLSNILANAIKYTEAGKVTLEVSQPASELISLEVRDTGPGVPEEMRERIFEPFNRADTQIPGTGLGLSISRTLARRMGGDLTLLPSQVGARFCLTFAFERAERQRPLPPETTELADLTGLRILVVDDIATNRLVAMTYLRLMAATSTEATTGAEALAAVTWQKPDIVLLDMLMPDMDGLATFAAIRGLNGPQSRVPVIAMTADASDEHRRAYLAAGLSGYVIKPLSPEELGAVILAALAAHRLESDMPGRN